MDSDVVLSFKLMSWQSYLAQQSILPAEMDTPQMTPPFDLQVSRQLNFEQSTSSYSSYLQN